MKKAKEYWNIYRADILMICVLGIVFGGLCLYRLMNNGEFSGDEFFSLEDTLGYAYTGNKLEWDFHMKSVNDIEVRLNPYFYLLAWWIRLVGIHAFRVRSLSVMIGMVAVFSFYLIVKKLTGSAEWAFLSGLLLSVNPEVITISTIVREYPLLLLLMIWTFYFVYKALNGKNSKEARNGLERFIHTWLDFDFRYGAAACILLYVAYRVRPFAVLYVIGVGGYVLVRAICTREKKFIVTSCMFWGIFLFFILTFIFHLEDYLPAVFAVKITGRLEKYASFGLRNLEYWRDALSVFRFIPIAIAGILLGIYHLCRRKRQMEKRQKDILVYMLLIAVFVLTVFTTLVNWSHNSRYLVCIYPIVIMVATGGFCIEIGEGTQKEKWLLYSLLILCATMNIPSIFTRDPAEEHFSEAYQTMAEHTGGEPVFITGINLRGFYARDLIPGYVWRPMTDKGDVPEIDHLAEICEIGREHPQGIITCEDSRWYHFRNSFWLLLRQDAFEQITGTGMDETNVENWAYHLAYPVEGDIPEDSGAVTLFGYNFGGVSRITEEEGKTVLELKLNGSVSELTMLCIKVNQYYAQDGRRQRYVQLILEPNGRSVQYYRIVLENDETPMKSLLDDSYHIYNNREDPESFEDCYVL